MTDRCSAWAYQEIVESGYMGKRQAQYLDIFISENRPLTHRQATQLCENVFCLALPERNGRIAELEQMGFIEKADLIPCPFTNKTVNRWKWTGRYKPLPQKEVEVCCPNCGGTGKVTKMEYVKEELQTELF